MLVASHAIVAAATVQRVRLNNAAAAATLPAARGAKVMLSQRRGVSMRATARGSLRVSAMVR